MKLLHYKPREPNFGDDLNAVLWPAFAPQLFADQAGDQADEAFVGIGTILGMDPGSATRLHVFSSGAGYDPADRWRDLDVRYHCVRGPLTAKVLGLDADRALTDGAILTPAHDKLGALGRKPQGRVVVVPHYETIRFPGWEQAARMAGFDLVDPRGTPAHVIEALASARLVLTESLHGAILADAFGIPWQGFAVSNNFSLPKWTDWAASLKIEAHITLVPPPDPLPLLRFGKRNEPFGQAVLLDPEVAMEEFKSRVTNTQRVPFIKQQAKRLLEVAPVTRRLLGFSPARTAEALSRLAERQPCLSADALRTSLRDQMLERLDGLVRSYSPSVASAV